MINIGTITLIVELLLAENIILISYPKRKFFWIRILGSSLICILLCGLFPSGVTNINPALYSLIRFTTCMIATVIVAFISYKTNPIVTVSSCTAGYAIQHITYHIYRLICLTTLFKSYHSEGIIGKLLPEIIVFIFVYILFILTVGIYVHKNKCYENYDRNILLISIFTIIIIIGLSRFVQIFNERSSVTNHFYAIVSCLLVLFLQYIVNRYIKLASENQIIRYLMEQKKNQYTISHDAIDLINIKYHDLKHRLSNMTEKISSEEIKEISDAMKITNSIIDTKSKNLNIIINNITIMCAKNNIQFTYIGDASILDKMSENDVISLFGNALENCLDAVKNITDPRKRIITMNVEQKGDFVNFNILNYYKGERDIREGRLISTKKDSPNFHGFGFKSMELIVEKYGGGIKYYTYDDVFHLNLYLIKK